MVIRDNTDYIGVLLYSYHTTITGRGGPPKVCTRSMTNLALASVHIDGARGFIIESLVLRVGTLPLIAASTSDKLILPNTKTV